MTDNTHIVVIGGGYAGLLAANRLTQREDVTVSMINPRSRFVERIRLHQLVGGSDDAVVEFRDILAERVRLVVDSVTRINASDRSVTLASGRTVGYEHLVYAAGSGSAGAAVPGGCADERGGEYRRAAVHHGSAQARRADRSPIPGEAM